ncbi:uncharacterized protein LOC116165367 [Photinus pyralis]|nr:uncharacterized protein LOC116165367 [Photinus pyralis]
MSLERKLVHSEARNIIRKVVEFFDRQKDAGRWSFPLEKATELAAAAVGKSVSFIKQIRKESDEAGPSKLKSPKKKRHVEPTNKIDFDEADQCILRRTVQEMYTVERKVPTLNVLVEKMQEKINYTGGRETLRKQLWKLGFRYKKCHDKRRLLMERSDIVAWRSRYLRRLRENEQREGDKRPVIYLDETYIHPSYGVSKCWQSDEVSGVYKSNRAGQRYIIVHAGGHSGFVEDGLLIFKSHSKSGDYHDDMNHTNFMQWLEKQLIPNLPANSIVVMDNAPYHSVQINKPPTMNNRKEVIRSWLDANNISTTEDMRKAELLMLVKNISHSKTYYVDELLKQHQHTVVRLPPYHCELNPIELIWSTMKRKVAMNNVGQSNSNIVQLVKNACAEITQQEWEKHCIHVKHIAEQMWEADCLTEEFIESVEFVVNTGSSDEDELSRDDNE